MSTGEILTLLVSAAVSYTAFLFASAISKRIKAAGNSNTKKLKLGRTTLNVLSIAALWFFLTKLITSLFGVHPEKLSVEIFAPKAEVFGFSISTSVVSAWIVVAIIIILALLFRVLCVPRFKDKPKGLQNVMELAVEAVSGYAKDNVHGVGDNLGAYIFTIAVFLIGCAAVELFGTRPPSADLVMTFSTSLVTFFLINYYAIKMKGVKGRVKSMASPSPVIFPMKVLSDVAVPVSMACRLFGNMLGGMIVIDLLYVALGNWAVGLPAVVGLYFNVFHPLIQTYIFVTLTLAFINEAVE